jgi:hypothetical protein
MGRTRSTFSYYGGKHRLVELYAPPRHDLIIEPFAGSAAYAYRYWERDVWVNDKDIRTYELWRFLTGGRISRDALQVLPRYVVVGQPVEEIADWSVLPNGLYELAQSLVSSGTYGERSKRSFVTPRAAPAWPRALRRIEAVFDRVAHWKITNLSYQLLPNIDASWFVDAPYNNAAGNRYRQRASGIDFAHLAAWCCGRRGQVVVCEEQGATWLPFVPLTRRTLRSHYPRRTASGGEVVYERWQPAPAEHQCT